MVKHIANGNLVVNGHTFYRGKFNDKTQTLAPSNNMVCVCGHVGDIVEYDEENNRCMVGLYFDNEGDWVSGEWFSTTDLRPATEEEIEIYNKRANGLPVDDEPSYRENIVK